MEAALEEAGAAVLTAEETEHFMGECSSPTGI